MTKDVKIILKSCPSCGAEAKVEWRIEGGTVDSTYSDATWWVKCRYCSFLCGGFQVRSNAIRRWNTRCKEVPSVTKV